MLSYLVYIILCFALLQTLVAFVNLIFGLYKSKTIGQDAPKLSVLIPARNEEKNIAQLLEDLRQDKDTILEILVYDDQSTDQTADRVQEIARKDCRIGLIPAQELPADWLGKNHACHRLAQQARGQYLLFLDADVRINPLLIKRMMNKMQNQSLHLISIFPKQVMRSFGEWLTVPLMNQILLSLLPLPLVEKSTRSSLAAANGQFMLFQAKEYHSIKPHQKLKSEKVEDISIARLYKQQQLKIACLASEDEVSCRMYENGQDGVQGFSKNVTHFFGNSSILAIIYWIMQLPGFVFVSIFGTLEATILLLALLILNRVFISISSHQNILNNILLYIPQQLSLGWIIIQAIVNQKNQSFQWKGRNISSLSSY
jgi:glycosyltransferase involved in cell wall biosynthesis